MQKTDLKENIRQNWGKTYSALPIMDLLAIQKRSYEWFQDVAIGETLREISPIDDFTEKIGA